jgi:hypothetical protein
MFKFQQPLLISSDTVLLDAPQPQTSSKPTFYMPYIGQRQSLLLALQRRNLIGSLTPCEVSIVYLPGEFEPFPRALCSFITIQVVVMGYGDLLISWTCKPW